jgi:hypothetical protein
MVPTRRNVLTRAEEGKFMGDDWVEIRPPKKLEEMIAKWISYKGKCVGYIAATLTVLASLFGSFLGSYMKKKGENLATRGALGDLVEQVRATTTATKAIEAKLSNEVWDRQRLWE